MRFVGIAATRLDTTDRPATEATDVVVMDALFSALAGETTSVVRRLLLMCGRGDLVTVRHMSDMITKSSRG